MTEFFIFSNSFAAPFVSDDAHSFVTAENASDALEQFAANYRHPAGLYAAAAYESGNAYHKGAKPLANWLCNHEIEKRRLTADLGSYSYRGNGPGDFEINGERHQDRKPEGWARGGHVMSYGRMYLNGLVDRETGRYLRSAIRAEIRKLTTRFWSPLTFQSALAIVLNEAQIEHSTVIDGIEWRKRFAVREAILERDAELLAATYGYEIDRLQFEIDRRWFGSFTTTLSGSPTEQMRYRRALAVAKARRAEMAQAAE